MTVPLAVVMISLNEAHNMEAVLKNLRGFASEVFLVDSYSSDATVDIAVRYGVNVVQRKFRGFGDQWNFALRELPITAPWTMKLDPDERITDELKKSISNIISGGQADAFTVRRRLWFIGQPLPIRQTILRGWKTGTCRFSDVMVNEHPLVSGRVVDAQGDLEHLDSPTAKHWLEKQNNYTTAEAYARFNNLKLAAEPRLLGSALERRMWLKKAFMNIPLRYQLYWAYNLYQAKVWRSGAIGFAWAKWRVWVRRSIEYKLLEMKLTGEANPPPRPKLGPPHPLARQID